MGRLGRSCLHTRLLDPEAQLDSARDHGLKLGSTRDLGKSVQMHHWRSPKYCTSYMPVGHAFTLYTRLTGQSHHAVFAVCNVRRATVHGLGKAYLPSLIIHQQCPPEGNAVQLKRTASSMLPHLDGLEFLDRFTEGWP